MATDLPGLTRLHIAPEANPDDLMCLPVRTVRQLTEAVGVAATVAEIVPASMPKPVPYCPVCRSSVEFCDGPRANLTDKVCPGKRLRAALAPFRGGA